jgi:HemY protein
MHASLLDALSHLLAGPLHPRAQVGAGGAGTGSIAHRLRAEAGQRGAAARHRAHARGRDRRRPAGPRRPREHLQLALEQASARDAQETRDGALLRAARWALEDREPEAAMQCCSRACRWARRGARWRCARACAPRARPASRWKRWRPRAAGQAPCLLAVAARSILRGLAIDLLNGAYDVAQLQRAWTMLEPAERVMPEVAIHAAQRLMSLRGDARLARDWLLPVWEAQSGWATTCA